VISGVRAMTQLGLSTFLPLYLPNVQRLPPAFIGLYLAAVQGPGMIATPIAGALSDRLGPKRIATVGMFSTSVVLVAFAAFAALGVFMYSMRPAIFPLGDRRGAPRG
jgi:nitrate/nitrite transporter NarK